MASYILFLGLDGVTHPYQGTPPKSSSEIKLGDTYFRQENVVEINRVIHKLKANVVIASSWKGRYHWPLYNNLFMGKVIGETPTIDAFLEGKEHIRYREIQRFLDEHNTNSIPWLAIDIYRDQFPPTAPVIITNKEQGLTRNQADTIIRWFAPSSSLA
ncbi:MAG: hypothetical protein CMF25_07655 [Kangiellaceae bacterium]|jgi:hypothetical protein|nr:hypothetical protein [Kangiellaceae bacterium]|tara:strand:- start:8425 stop:8898 length:474 start_codon:yes stop_codon:yes gene_type:complete